MCSFIKLSTMKDKKIWRVENMESIHDDSETDDKADSSIGSDHL